MALVKCSECGSQVSSSAAACPKCGAPVSAAAGGQSSGAPLTTIQETGKRLKAQILGAAVLFWGGMFAAFIGAQGRTPGEEPATVAPTVMVVGLVWYVVTKARIWWHHH